MAEQIDYQSISHHSWRKFKKNRIAMTSLYFILFAFVIALLGYLITPDPTPDANNQILELSKQSPGFEVEMLLHRKNEATHEVNIFNKMLFGERSDVRSIPIESFRFEGADIVYKEFTGRRKRVLPEQRINIADLVYSLDVSIGVMKYGSELSYFLLEDKKEYRKTIRELRSIILDNNLVSKRYYLGTDLAGRDLLSRLMIGTRISFSVGIVAVLISVFLGIFFGAIAGYYRGWVDNFIVWFFNVVWAVPTILLVIAISLALGRGFWQMFIAVGLTMWVEVARVIRGQIISVREKEFVEAGVALGFSRFRIIFKHILPNVMGSVIIIATANFSAAILIEAGLSFLGIGAQPPTPSWGAMISEHRTYMIGDYSYLAFLPGFTTALLILSFVLVGNGLRDAIDSNVIDEAPVV